MKQVPIAELKDHLSEHLRAVRGGDEIEVTDRRTPVARIVPIAPAGDVHLLPAEKPVRALRHRRYPPARWPKSSLALLCEERRKR